MCTVLKVTEEEIHEISVHALITADELIWEGKAGYQAPPQPEDGHEQVKEDTIDGSLDFVQEMFNEVLVDDVIGCSK